MNAPVLRLEDVSVAVDGHRVCHGINLAIGEGETHILLGPNGSGKSSLLSAIMGVGPFTIESGTVTLLGHDITDATATEKARAGLGMAFQHPPKLDGVTLERLAHAVKADADLQKAAEALQLTHLISRDVNSGFSGGETKRWEVMKLLLQKPRMCLFDEPESGVDLAHVAVVGEAVNKFLVEDPHRAALIITHTGFILDHLETTCAHLMVNGRIAGEGDARTMFDKIRRHGYGV